MSEIRYPIGIQSFEKLRKGGYVYVDKTQHIDHLVRNGGYYFLSRPRRFGKSLLISTLEAYFRGKKDLFHGLAIEETEKEWKEYPVLHLDLNTGLYDCPEALQGVLHRHLEKWEEEYGDAFKDRPAGERLLHVVELAYKKTSLPVVLLVDEYDKPLLQSLDNDELQANYRAQLKAFYSVLKTQDRYIRFALLTGVTRFSKISIFSDLNNLKDISIDEQFADVCGITDEEIDRYFNEAISEIAEVNGLTYDEVRRNLKERYDGYHFDIKAVGVYNPFSLLNALYDKRLRDYWFASGTPTFLVELLKENDYNLEQLKSVEVTVFSLINIDSYRDNPIPLLYQSGYLTIIDGDPDFGLYTLGFPNGEVERGFVDFLLPYYAPIQRDKTGLAMKNFTLDIRGGHPEAFMQRLQAFYANANFKIAGDMEKYFHNSLFLIFTLMGQYTEAEYHTSQGSIDLLVKTADYIYIIECKLDRSAEEAIRQIDEKGYAAPFAMDSRKLFKIGVNFSSKTRGIDEYLIA